MNYPRTHYRYFVLIAVFLSVATLTIPSLISAQETATPEGTPIEISGVVSQVGNGTITVAGLTVNVSVVPISTNVTVGMTVRVTGYLLPTNVVVAQVITIVTPSVTATSTVEGTPEATPEVTPSATLTPNPSVVIVVEGPVVNIVSNIITIYNFNIELEPTNPMLNIIDIGDIVHVEGVFSGSGVIVASVVSNVTNITTVSNGATAGLEGPIEAINGNIVIVNGIPVQFASDDPRLVTLQIGDFLNVQGNFQGSGTTVVLVVINVTIINNVVINGNPLCWFHVDGMGMGMGHWHCDGMGMGDDGMGMGMGMGLEWGAVGMGVERGGMVAMMCAYSR
jgi:hypothetical protein